MSYIFMGIGEGLVPQIFLLLTTERNINRSENTNQFIINTNCNMTSFTSDEILDIFNKLTEWFHVYINAGL